MLPIHLTMSGDSRPVMLTADWFDGDNFQAALLQSVADHIQLLETESPVPQQVAELFVPVN